MQNVTDLQRKLVNVFSKFLISLSVDRVLFDKLFFNESFFFDNL